MKFRLSGINNQNFLMTDEETGSWWQQISGIAVAGPLKGRRLTRVFHDEVAFRLWLREHPATRVLVPAADTAWINFSRNWEEETATMPVATRARISDSLPARTLVLGLEVGEESKAWPMSALERQLLIVDRLGGRTVALVLGEDGKSVRAFEPRVDSTVVELYVVPGSQPLVMRDGQGNAWDWSGTATSGPLAGRKLVPLPVIKDYWFDWKTYHPRTLIYTLGPQ
jgi:hypothetical protein